jgi:phospholipase/lecithinase/hemolysin
MRAPKTFALLALVVLTTLPIAGQQAPTYEAFYAFGDSLVDNGNDYLVTQVLLQNPPVPPSTSPHRAYYNGRFSNGPVAFEYLWQILSGKAPGTKGSLQPFLSVQLLAKKEAIDFAFGGSGTSPIDTTPGGFTVPGLRGQVDLFRTLSILRKPSPKALYAIFAGPGDYFKTTPLTPDQSVGNIVTSIRALYSVGARTVIVLNMPDLGSVPMFAGTPQSAPLSALSAAHNAALATALASLQASLPSLRLIPIDINAVMQQLPPTMNPALPAVDALVPVPPPGPPTSLCLFINPATCPNVPTFDVGLQYLFWDAQHPTTEVHRLLAQYLFQQLTQS